jgi:hypothetical protein
MNGNGTKPCSKELTIDGDQVPVQGFMLGAAILGSFVFARDHLHHLHHLMTDDETPATVWPAFGFFGGGFARDVAWKLKLPVGRVPVHPLSEMCLGLNVVLSRPRTPSKFGMEMKVFLNPFNSSITSAK